MNDPVLIAQKSLKLIFLPLFFCGIRKQEIQLFSKVKEEKCRKKFQVLINVSDVYICEGFPKF